MLLVTGATGTTGMEVLQALKARGAEARALVRDETKAHHLRDLGFEPATGDLGDPRTLGPALEGVERAYLVSPISPMQSEFEQAFLETAKEAGVKHIVKLLGDRRVSPEAPLRFARTHAQGRDRAEGVRDGLDAAAARPASCRTRSPGARACSTAPSTRRSPTRRSASSTPATSPRSPPWRSRRRATRARRTASAAPRPSPTATRPGACSPPPGARSTVEEIPVETLKRELVRAGVPPWNAEGLSELFELYAGGGAQMVTSGVKDALDRDPRGHRRLREGPRGLVQGAA